jgi:hypothetical protein
MKKGMKKGIYILTSVGIFLFSVTIGVVTSVLFCNKGESINLKPVDQQQESETEGLMLMIEFEGTEGLVNFVDQIKERDIPGLLIARAEFVEENCEVIKSLLEYHDVEIAGSAPGMTFWDVPYEEQESIIRETKEKIFACTGREIRVMSSRYFAYDENTLKAAQANGIEYVLARGTTGAKATIYQPEEYDVKIFSVSNVASQNWGTGSLCDYSYWAREGTPEDFQKELFNSLENDQISPVSHTYLGGLKESWNNVYVKFMDEANVNWVDLDTFGQTTVVLPFASIPDNREVQYETPHPATPLEEEKDVDNPCAVEDITQTVSSDTGLEDNEILVFHNGTGPMCIELLGFLNDNSYEYTEYLNTQDDFYTILNSYKENFTSSEGVSDSFGSFPIIFIEDRAFSGFNDEVQYEIILLME